MPRSQTNSEEFVAGALPTITCNGKKYFVDGRMQVMRNTEDFMDELPDNDYVWKLLSKKDKAIITYEFYGSRT